MSNYQRLISYIYAYEGGIKGKNIGFVKLETRNTQCRIAVNVKRIFVSGNPMGVYLLSEQGELRIGEIFARNGSGEFRTAVNAGDIESSGHKIEEFYGLSIHDTESAWRAYTTIWEDAVAHAAEIELSEVTSEKLLEKQMGNIGDTEKNSEISLPISGEIERALELESVEVSKMILSETDLSPYDNQDVTPEPESTAQTMPPQEPIQPMLPQEPIQPMPPQEPMQPMPPREPMQPMPPQEPMQPMPPQEPSQPLMSQHSTPMTVPHTPRPEFIQAGEAASEETKIPSDQIPIVRDENELINHQGMWDFLRKRYAKISAFDYEDGSEILVIKPQDIGILPRDNWVYGNNSFLLHGYYNYRYLILARLENPMGMPRYLLGVPGKYYSNEKYMAAMFGFPDFVLSKNQPSSDGRFGYWYSDIKIGESS